MFRFSFDVLTAIPPFSCSSAFRKGSSVSGLGLSFEVAVMEIDPPSRGGFWILFEKDFDTSAARSGSSCAPAAFLSVMIGVRLSVDVMLIVIACLLQVIAGNLGELQGVDEAT